MSRKDIIRVCLFITLLAVGIWIIFYLEKFPSDPQFKSPDELKENAFRWVFWEDRPLDLIVQACLIIAGALGVAAILPSEEEE